MGDKVHVAAGAEGDRLDVAAQVRLEERLAGGNHGRRAGLQVADQLCLRGGHVLDRAEQLEVHRADVHDQPHVRLRDLDELRDLAGAAHRHLEHHRLGAALGLEDRERHADLGVQVLAVRVGRALCPEDRGEDVLGRGLAGRPRYADRLRVQLAAPASCQRLQGR